MTRGDIWLTPDPQHKWKVSSSYIGLSLVDMLCNMDKLYHF